MLTFEHNIHTKTMHIAKHCTEILKNQILTILWDCSGENTTTIYIFV